MSNEVKLVFDNESDRDKIVNDYTGYDNGVYRYSADVKTDNDDYNGKYSATFNRGDIEDFTRMGQDAKLYGADIHTNE